MTILEKLKIKIMEKDKIIFKNRQKELELNTNIEKLNSELNSQKLINEKLNNKIQLLEQNLKEHKENEKISQISEDYENNEKYNELKNENINLTKKVNELSELLNSKEITWSTLIFMLITC